MPRRIKAAAAVDRDEARELYLRIFDDFALEVYDKGDQKRGERIIDNRHLQPVVDAINVRLDGSNLTNGEAGQTIVRDWVNSDYEVWQCFQTYDSWTHEQAEAAFDTAWPVDAPALEAAPAASAGGCLCGCGLPTSKGKAYRPGHDARHAGQVAGAILALPAGPKVKAETIRLIDTLPTLALQNKALTQVTRGNTKTPTKPAKTAKPSKTTRRRKPSGDGPESLKSLLTI